MAIQYAFRHIRRDWRRGLAILAVSLSLALLISTLSSAERRQLNQIDATMRDTPVRAVVSDVYGYRLDDLHILPIYIDVLSDPNSNIAQHLKDLCVKRAIYCRAVDSSGENLPLPSTTKLIGITRLAADPMLSEDNGTTVAFFEGYSEEFLLGDTPVCLVNQDMLGVLGDAKTVRLDFTEAVDARRMRIEEEKARGATLPGGEDVGVVELTIIGTISGGISDALYCPWAVIRPIDERILGYALGDSMSFTVRDNYRLNELKIFLRGYFVQTTPGFSEGGGGAPKVDMPPVALTIRDGDLVRVISPLERSVAFLKVIIPLLLCLSIGIGFLASYLCIRSRKAEFALMRSMGTAKGAVFAAVFIEQLALCAAGCAVGFGVVAATNNITSQGALWSSVFLVCFMLGASFSVWRIIRVNVMSAMKAKE